MVTCQVTFAVDENVNRTRKLQGCPLHIPEDTLRGHPGFLWTYALAEHDTAFLDPIIYRLVAARVSSLSINMQGLYMHVCAMPMYACA